jgi:hypothetical protein
MQVMSIPKFERFFRSTASLDIDKQDLKRFSDFINHKLYDLLVRGEAISRANGRDRIEPIDLPITKGLQATIDEFSKLDEELELAPILDHLAARPPLAVPLSDETEAQLAVIAGGISIALARSFKILDPKLKNPQSEHWERSFRIFDLLL